MRNTIVKKPWGQYEIIYEEPKRVVKILTVEPGQSLSRQSHSRRSEHWFVLRGRPEVNVGDSTVTLEENGAIEIPAGTIHRLSNPTRDSVMVLETQYGDEVDENDIVRYEDRYGRRVGDAPYAFEDKLEPPVSICEIGCNHKGDLTIAIEMIKIAAQFCGVDVVKFQKRCARELLSPIEYDAPHPNPHFSYGETYGKHREFLEFDLHEHARLKDACSEWGVVYSTSVWDTTSAREIVSLNPLMIKVPSACNSNFPLLEYLFSDYGGQIHISLGMTTHAEENDIVEFADKKSRLSDLVLYHCVSGYPVDDEDLSLLDISRLRKAYGGQVLGIGFSGHHRGIAPDMAALTLGAQYFERHFTLDRSWKGTDNAASLEPNGLRLLTRDLRNVTAALRRHDKEVLDVEHEQRKKLKKRVPMESEVN